MQTNRKMSGATVGMLGYVAGADARQAPGNYRPERLSTLNLGPKY